MNIMRIYSLPAASLKKLALLLALFWIFELIHGYTFCLFSTDMVKNKGFLPSGPSEIHTQRNHLKDIIFSLLPACQDDDPESKIPFKADAIIANPPAYG